MKNGSKISKALCIVLAVSLIMSVLVIPAGAEKDDQVNIPFYDNNFYFDWDKDDLTEYFGDTTVFNYDLIRISTRLSYYGCYYKVGGTTLTGLLKNLGFDKVAYQVRFGKNVKDEDGNVIGDPATAYSIFSGDFNINGETKKIVAVLFCASDTSSRYVSNFDFFCDGYDTLSYAKSSAEIVFNSNEFQNTVKSAQDNNEDFIIWTMGYCRGAGCANYLGHMVNQAYGVEHGFTVTNQSMNVTTEPIAYENIYNVVYPEDLTVHVPLAAWGFGRYGIDLVLDTSATNPELFSELKETYPTYPTFTDELYTYGDEISELNNLLKKLYKICPQPKDYDTTKLLMYYTPEISLEGIANTRPAYLTIQYLLSAMFNGDSGIMGLAGYLIGTWYRSGINSIGFVKTGSIGGIQLAVPTYYPESPLRPLVNFLIDHATPYNSDTIVLDIVGDYIKTGGLNLSLGREIYTAHDMMVHVAAMALRDDFTDVFQSDVPTAPSITSLTASADPEGIFTVTGEADAKDGTTVSVTVTAADSAIAEPIYAEATVAEGAFTAEITLEDYSEARAYYVSAEAQPDSYGMSIVAAPAEGTPYLTVNGRNITLNLNGATALLLPSYADGTGYNSANKTKMIFADDFGTILLVGEAGTFKADKSGEYTVNVYTSYGSLFQTVTNDWFLTATVV